MYRLALSWLGVLTQGGNRLIIINYYNIHMSLLLLLYMCLQKWLKVPTKLFPISIEFISVQSIIQMCTIHSIMIIFVTSFTRVQCAQIENLEPGHCRSMFIQTCQKNIGKGTQSANFHQDSGMRRRGASPNRLFGRCIKPYWCSYSTDGFEKPIIGPISKWYPR